MLEILGVFWLTRIVARMLRAKGFSPWAAALVPLVWFMTEMVIVMAVLITAPDTDIILVSVVGMIAGFSSGGVMYFIVKRLDPRPATTYDAPVVAPPAAQAPVASAPQQSGRQALAGYCHECEKNVWLTSDGACENGHDRDSVSGVYWALR